MILSSYEWQEPKTDWSTGSGRSGDYDGDTFEPADYNRIKNNINFLRDFVEQLYDNKPVCSDLGADVYYGSPHELTASWWTGMQENLENINLLSVATDIGTAEDYEANGAGRLVDELNRVEQACLDIYRMLLSTRQCRTRLSVRLGSRGGIKC